MLKLSVLDLGFTRFWVAEHHNLDAVAATSPAVLIAHLAANTSRIRVGSGGVMLPDHAPLTVAEQFSLLEAGARHTRHGEDVRVGAGAERTLELLAQQRG